MNRISTSRGCVFGLQMKRQKDLADCSEIGGRYLVRLPAFLVRTGRPLTKRVLRRACALGAQLWRPATVQKVELVPGGKQKLVVRHQERTDQIQARWVVECFRSVAALLARQEGWWRPNHAPSDCRHAWSRWKGVKDFDGLELAPKNFRCWAKACYGVRGTSTNHLMGDG